VETLLTLGQQYTEYGILGGVVFGLMVTIVLVIRHYDKRNEELQKNYRDEREKLWTSLEGVSIRSSKAIEELTIVVSEIRGSLNSRGR
jgi:hypothetical protein